MLLSADLSNLKWIYFARERWISLLSYQQRTCPWKINVCLRNFYIPQLEALLSHHCFWSSHTVVIWGACSTWHVVQPVPPCSQWLHRKDPSLHQDHVHPATSEWCNLSGSLGVCYGSAVFLSGIWWNSADVRISLFSTDLTLINPVSKKLTWT